MAELTVRCLTIWQPFAGAIACGLKHWEVRSQRTNYRGKVAIHAARPEAKAPPEHPVWSELVSGDGCTLIDGLRPLAFSAVIAVADLTDCVPILDVIDTEHYPGPYIERGCSYLYLWRDGMAVAADISDQLPYGDWEFKSWAWRLDSVRRISSPIPAKGRLGLWNPHGYPLPGDPDGDLGAEIVRALGVG